MLQRSYSRTTTSTVRFDHAFTVGRDTRELPAGVYAIHTHEEMYEGAFQPLFVQTGVDLVVDRPGGSSTRLLRPADLREALARDAARFSLLTEPSENPVRGKAVERTSGAAPDIA